MIDWIPLNNYTPIYYYVMFVVIVLTLLQSQVLDLKDKKNIRFVRSMGLFVLIFVLIYMGLRPISGRYFGDMAVYAQTYERYQDGYPITHTKDPVFHLFMKISAQIMSVTMFFTLCALLYVLPLYYVCKKWFGKYWFYGFLMLVTAFSFWSAGTNGIRNGIAGTFFIIGISRDKRIFQILWFFLAASFHLSIILPVLIFVIIQFYNKPNRFIIFWLLCIPLSLISGGFWESFFANLGFEDDRLSYLTEEGDVTQFSAVGFRWDFLIYSATGVFAGWYYIIKRKFQDPVYNELLSIYVLANAFWVLVIGSDFSNRFAYLSWFLMPLVIIYPLLKQYIVKRQHKKIGVIILIHFLFTFILNVILA